MSEHTSRILIRIVLPALVLLSVLGYGFYYLYMQLESARTDISARQSEIASTSDALIHSVEQKDALEQALANERAQNATYETQLGIVATKVSNLTKLVKIDKELLQKYSKVYFLNENYVPVSLATITPAYTLTPSRSYSIHTEVSPFLEQMLTDANSANAPILVLSAYRSFGDQASLKSVYKVTYGSGANRFSADQGYSEHQLGTAVDFTTKSIGTTATTFATSPGGVWLSQNAYKYGFILSYPRSNSYYMYEPWHYRFVGVGLATYIHNQNTTFYALDQRYIDTYLVDLFDK